MKILFIIFSLVAFETLAQQAYFCRECNDLTSARTQALRYTPELRCDFDPVLLPELGDGATACSSEIKRVILVNPDDETKIFAFYVGHNSTSPYRSYADLDSLSPTEQSQYSELAVVYQFLTQAILQAQNTSVTATQDYGVYLASASNCPQDTALDTFTDPQKMEDLKTRTIVAIGLRLGEGRDIDLSRVQWGGFGLSYKGVSASWSKTTKQLIYAKSFENSEVTHSISDVLVFKLEYLGVDSSNNLPLLNFELDQSSRIAGMTLSGLQGQFGPLAITNECVLEKLERLELQGEFRDGLGSPVDFGGSNSGGGGSVSEPDLCTYDFYNSRGERQYTFRAPCP